MSAKPSDSGPHDIATTYVHLRDGGAGTALPIRESFWEDVMAGKHPELEQGRLMGHHAFAENWPSWERHPHGEEFLMLLTSAADFVLDENGRERVVSLRTPGSYVLVLAGTWHTARTKQSSSILFITPGRGTEPTDWSHCIAARNTG